MYALLSAASATILKSLPCRTARNACDFPSPWTVTTSEDGSRPTDWIPVVIWGSANYCRKVHLGKGDKVCVTGRWEINNWTDNDGIPRTTGALNCTGIELTGHRTTDKNQAAQEGAAATNPESNTAVDEDFPF